MFLLEMSSHHFTALCKEEGGRRGEGVKERRGGGNERERRHEKSGERESENEVESKKNNLRWRRRDHSTKGERWR